MVNPFHLTLNIDRIIEVVEAIGIIVSLAWPKISERISGAVQKVEDVSDSAEAEFGRTVISAMKDGKLSRNEVADMTIDAFKLFKEKKLD